MCFCFVMNELVRNGDTERWEPSRPLCQIRSSSYRCDIRYGLIYNIHPTRHIYYIYKA